MTQTSPPAHELHDTAPQDLTGIVGYRFFYAYGGDWQYEAYVKNETTVDYRIHTGPVGGRWVRDQTAQITRIGDDAYKLAWTEPTGTSVVTIVMPSTRSVHGTVFFPQWLTEDPTKTVVYQNDHLEAMHAYRDAGPTYPITVISEYAEITLYEYLGENDETVISQPPSELPTGFCNRTNP